MKKYKKLLIIPVVLIIVLNFVFKGYLINEKKLAKKIFNIDINASNVLEVKNNVNIWNQSGDFLVVLTMNKADAINKAKEYSDGSEFGGEVALNVAHKQFNLDKEQLESWGSCDEEPVKYF